MQSTNKRSIIIEDEKSLNIRCSRVLGGRNILSLSREEIIKLTLIAECGPISMCYAPLAHMNFQARVILVGLTPGWSQMNVALLECVQRLQNSHLAREMDVQRGHIASYFAGSLRANLINMLDEIGINSYLGIQTVSSLFGQDRRLMHATSVLRYPVFNKYHNYTGYNPRIDSSPLLAHVVDTVFLDEILRFRGCTVIPLGKIASSCIARNANVGKYLQIIHGLPHPSSANGHRLKQFRENLHSLRSQVRQLR